VKVLFVTSAYPTPEQPVAGTFVEEHARAAAQHDDVMVLHLDRSLDHRGKPRVTSTRNDIPLTRVTFPWRPVPWSAALALPATAIGWRALRGFRPDVIHAHFFLAGVPAVLLGKALRRPVLVTEQWSVFLPEDPMQLNAPLRRAAAFAYGNAAAVLPASEALQRGIQAEGLHARRFAVIPNVVDTSLFAPGAAPRNDRLLAVGLLYEAKGYDTLLGAIAELARRGRRVDLDIVGDGPLRAALQQQARTLGIAEQVTFHGVLPKARVAEMMREAPLFVLASNYDNNPCVVIEAEASGLPVVATAVGGVPELVRPANGRLAPPGDPGALATEIAVALDELDGFDRDAIAADARRRFGREAIGARLHELYAEVAA
jgi:glycosyltransferase involved in cell wall biosynthesis